MNSKEIDPMYPSITQHETRRREIERELALIRARDQARGNDAERTRRLSQSSSQAMTEMAPGTVRTGISDSRPQAPPRHKLALLTWVGAYAVITLILEVLGPVMAPWPLAVRALVLSALMVSALTWAVVPMLARLFRGWLVAQN